MIHNDKGFGFIEPAGFSWLTMMKWEAERNILIFIKNCELNSRFSTSCMAQHCVPWPRKFFFSVLSQMPRRKKNNWISTAAISEPPTKYVNSFLVDLVVPFFSKSLGNSKKQCMFLRIECWKTKLHGILSSVNPNPKTKHYSPSKDWLAIAWSP